MNEIFSCRAEEVRSVISLFIKIAADLFATIKKHVCSMDSRKVFF